LYRLFSIRRSYIKRRSRTLGFEKSFMAKRPRARWGANWDGSWCGQSWALSKSDFVSLLSGLESLRWFRASIVWFWMLQMRLRRQERLTMRWASIDSIGLAGANSASIWSRWRSNSAWLSELITSWAAVSPCLTAFCETAALPSLVRGPVDFWALLRLARIWDWVDMILLLKGHQKTRRSGSGHQFIRASGWFFLIYY